MPLQNLNLTVNLSPDSDAMQNLSPCQQAGQVQALTRI